MYAQMFQFILIARKEPLIVMETSMHDEACSASGCNGTLLPVFSLSMRPCVACAYLYVYVSMSLLVLDSSRACCFPLSASPVLQFANRKRRCLRPLLFHSVSTVFNTPISCCCSLNRPLCGARGSTVVYVILITTCQNPLPRCLTLHCHVCVFVCVC